MYLILRTVKVLLFVGTNCRSFVISNITGNNKWENCNSLDFNIRGLSDQRNPRKLETPRLILISQYMHDNS